MPKTNLCFRPDSKVNALKDPTSPNETREEGFVEADEKEVEKERVDEVVSEEDESCRKRPKLEVEKKPNYYHQYPEIDYGNRTKKSPNSPKLTLILNVILFLKL